MWPGVPSDGAVPSGEVWPEPAAISFGGRPAGGDGVRALSDEAQLLSTAFEAAIGSCPELRVHALGVKPSVEAQSTAGQSGGNGGQVTNPEPHTRARTATLSLRHELSPLAGARPSYDKPDAA